MPAGTTRAIYKTVSGDKVEFEEVNHDLKLQTALCEECGRPQGGGNGAHLVEASQTLHWGGGA